MQQLCIPLLEMVTASPRAFQHCRVGLVRRIQSVETIETLLEATELWPAALGVVLSVFFLIFLGHRSFGCQYQYNCCLERQMFCSTYYLSHSYSI